MKTTLPDTTIDLSRITDPRGNLTFVENGNGVPFNIQRAYWVYDVPSGEDRGEHAHKACRELIVAVSGSFTVTLDNGEDKKAFQLNHPYQALLVDKGIWRKLEDFSSGAVCMVLASDKFTEADYLRNYQDFLDFIKD